MKASDAGLALLMTIATALATCVGCGKSDWGTVRGVVTVDGSPVGPGTLVFEPAEPERANRPSSLGHFNAEGAYELVSVGKERGAPVGEYRVVIMEGGPASLTHEGAAAAAVNTQIPPRYQDYDAGLTATIEQGSQEINFELTK